MASQAICSIEKLIGRENFQTWKFAVKSYLEHEDLWETVEPGAQHMPDAKKDTKAKSKIILLIDPINYVHIQDATTAKQPRAPRSPDLALRHSLSAHSVKEYAPPGDGDCCFADRPERGAPEPWEPERVYPSAVMAERRGFTRRPVARNSNLLSAVLCLVKELDYPSLEVAEMAVRCRMDELAHEQ